MTKMVTTQPQEVKPFVVSCELVEQSNHEWFNLRFLVFPFILRQAQDERKNAYYLVGLSSYLKW